MWPLNEVTQSTCNNWVCNFFLRYFLFTSQFLVQALSVLNMMFSFWYIDEITVIYLHLFLNSAIPFIPVFTSLTIALVNNNAVWDMCDISYNNCTPTQVILGCLLFLTNQHCNQFCMRDKRHNPAYRTTW